MTDTIAAIATGMMNSGIGIVRVSGPESLIIVDRIFSGDLTIAESHRIYYGHIKKKDEIIDEVLLLIMKSPKSYTTEDVVEIHCHGGILVTRDILDTVLSAGARLAEPGEFTKRAFLNGRIDLTEAESVMDLISAKSEFARKSSILHLSGALYQKISELKGVILEKNAYIEAALDDPEHYDLNGFPEELKQTVMRVQSEIRELMHTFESGRRMTEGIRTVITGRPNVGKSSLLNFLLHEDRAIVTEIPGTTRDTLEETIELDGLLLRMVDTAGIRSASDPVEEIGVDRARSEWENADLILLLLDGSGELTEEDRQLIRETEGKQTILLATKSDLPAIADLSGLPVLPFSVKTGEGKKELVDRIKNLFFDGKLQNADTLMITNLRQKNLLTRAGSALSRVLESLDNGLPEDFYTIDLMDAYSALSILIGEEVTDDLVDEVFSKFCMGK